MRSVSMAEEDRLEIRDSNGISSEVPNNGTEVWRIGFVKDNGDGTIGFGGYANNEPYKTFPEWAGLCFGNYTSNVFEDGDTADEVLIVHDKNGDGVGYINGGKWYVGADDTHYWSEDIEFNGVQGDISQLGTFNYIETKILPQMTINVRSPRTDPAGINELEALSENWLRQDCHPYDNADCDCADWDYDGQVNFEDFSYMAQGWDPNYISE